MADVGYTASQLDSALASLRVRWEAARAAWNDAVQRAFERDCWLPLEQEAQATVREMERLAQVIAQAMRAVQ